MTPNHDITHPFEHDSAPRWERRSPENQNACARLREAIRRRSDRVYVIRFGLRGPKINGKWPKRDYPRIFTSANDAWDWMAVDKDFVWPADAKSASVEPVRFDR